ncbi:hypothetical protein [Sphingosinicella microcystinivorans]|uniref:Uncharacterized protein n=1 Tax=Sphingosinicella microcystinivorans TaxID=335406 RepID=A0AAD1D392_SPHMI|nr:hypothetical protein [Sphingosinicella microcystinivorans]RKS88797.1 hypothetical protein DFR51_2007 [Sphingosinicella microcystinivorans]BBE32553.1 hypothetical protein SmB9_02110 [Sphingosinicella microcystinivorans]
MKQAPFDHRDLGNVGFRFCNDTPKPMECLRRGSGKILNAVSTLAKFMLRCNNATTITARKGVERVEAREAMMRIRCLAGPVAAV